MIKKILLENWKSHAKSEFEFAQGTNVLVGISGSGKTSVMDAVCFALYGTFPLANARTVKLEEVIMQKPSQKDSSTIKLEFEYNGKNYEITRMLSSKASSQATLKENGRLIAGPKPLEVTQRIEEITETSYELFSRAIYSEQNQTDYFLKLNPAQRKEKIDDLLMINKYETVRANAVSLQNRVKKHAEDKKAWLKEIKEKFSESELAETQKKIMQKTTRAQNAIAEKELLKKSLEALEKNALQLQEKEKNFEFFRELLIKTDSKTEELKKITEQTKKMAGEKSVGDLSERIKKIQQEVLAAQKEIVQKKLEHKEFQKQANDTIQQKGALSEKAFQKEKQLKELKNTKANCPVCNRKLEEHQKDEIIQETLQEQEKTRQMIEQLEKTRKETEKKQKETQEQAEKAEEKKHQLQKEELKTAQLLKEADQLEQRQKELQVLTEEKQKIEQHLKNLNFSKNEMDEQKKAISGTKEKMRLLEQEVQMSSELTEQLKQHEKKLLETKKQINEVEQKHGKLLETQEELTIFVNTLKETQAELRYSLINTVNEAMQDIWQNIYPYSDLESAKIEISDSGNYEILVKQKNGPWTRVEGILSGGERSCVALTMRIAISLVLTQNLSWLILDEPTHNLDTNTVARFAQMLNTHLPELVKQIFIITHDKEMEQAANASLYYLEREKDSNSATKPTLMQTK